MKEGEYVEGQARPSQVHTMSPQDERGPAPPPAAGRGRVEEVLVDEQEAAVLGYLPELTFSLEEWEALSI